MKINDDTNKKISDINTLSDLNEIHKQELQRLSLDYNEKFRQSEIIRSKLEEKLELQEEKISELSEKYRNDLLELLSNNTKINEEKFLLQNEIQSLKNQLDKSQFEKTVWTKSYTTLTDELNNSRNQIEKLSFELQNKEVVVNEFRTSFQEKNLLLGQSESKYYNLERLSHKLEIEKQILENDFERLSLEFDDQKNVIKLLNESRHIFETQLLEHIGSLDKMIADGIDEREKNFSLYEIELEKLHQKIEILTNEITSIQIEKNRIETIANDFREFSKQAEIKLLESEADRFKQKEWILEIETILIERNHQIDGLVAEVGSKIETIDSITNLQEEAMHREKALQSFSHKLSDDLIEKQENINRLKERIEVLECELSDAKIQFNDTVKRNAENISGLTLQLAALQFEEKRYRNAMIIAEKKVQSTKKTLSFQLGYALVQAGNNWSGLKQLPFKLYELYCLHKAGNFKGGSHNTNILEKYDSNSDFFNTLNDIYIQGGVDEVERYLSNNDLAAIDKANGYTKIAKLILSTDLLKACRFARMAVECDPRTFRRKWLAFTLYDAGNITEAYEILSSLGSTEHFKPSEKFKALRISGSYKLLNEKLVIPSIKVQTNNTNSRLMYVASSSLPYHISGYTLRTHAILQSLLKSGIDVVCVTRPGYPDDRHDSIVIHDSMILDIEGIRYESIEGPNRRKIAPQDYIKQSAELLVNKAQSIGAGVIQAASNHENALPALIAARELGLPFIYEVRGLWEYTASSKLPGWELTEAFALDRKLESFVAMHADVVLTLTNALANELVKRGVERNKIKLFPNAVDNQKFQSEKRDILLAETLNLTSDNFTVGYIGSLVGYEGLDDLIDALSILSKENSKIRCLIVGDGDAKASLEQKVQFLGMQHVVIFTGKVNPEDVNHYYSLLDTIVLPRKPYEVCKLVSPLKPLEAMAMGIPVIASDVAALKEMFIEGKTGLIFPAGNINALSESIIMLIEHPELKSNIIKNAYDYVINQRTWDTVIQQILPVYPTCLCSNISQNNNLDVDSNKHISIDTVFLPSGKNSMTDDEKKEFDEKILQSLKLGGVTSLYKLIECQSEGRSVKFASFCDLKAANGCLNNGYINDALNFAEQALSKDRSATGLRGAARVFYNAAELIRAKELVDELESVSSNITDSDRKFIDEINGRVKLLELAKMPTSRRNLSTTKKRVLNILAFSLPYTSVGYATRSHGLAQGIMHAGWEIHPYTRPGFPYDFKSELEGQVLPDSDEIDGITYHRIFNIERKGQTETEYILSAVDHLEKVIDEVQPSVVHAASNYVTALPALIAARRKGIPFVYEVRGFWEVTRSSRDDDFINTPKYRYMQLFEALVACEADCVITITTAMKEELIERGVVAENIAIAYNSVDPERFLPSPKNFELSLRLGIPDGIPVIGYIGSFVDYEGLDDLIVAVSGLKEEGIDFRLLMVGDGAVFDVLKQQVKDLELEENVLLTGRIPHEEVEEYYSLIDIAPFPRKPWEVCELVSPLKPFEAMALEKAVIVSSTRALVEIVQDGYNGLVFEKGNTMSLQTKLRELILSREERISLGKHAREWILKERSWNVSGQVCVNHYLKAVANNG